MFTGIVQGLAQVASIKHQEKLHQLKVRFPSGALDGVCKGASIALNGCCLTVVEFDMDAHEACFDVMQESLRLTNLGDLTEASCVNFERAAKIGDEIGGHLMSGHISTIITVVDRIETDTNCELVFECPPNIKPYILPKGFVGLDGCSLTVGETVNETFSVHLIPETLAVTRFGDIQVGEKVNLEVDPQTQAIVDTVERVLANKA